MSTQSFPRRRLDPYECEIVMWRGYVKSTFYARCLGPDGDYVVIAESPTFRFRGGDGREPSPAVRRAHEDLLDELRAAGWQVVGSGSVWYQVRLRRESGA